MDRAINKKTGEILRAVGLKKNASYQEPLKEKWIAPEDSIKNWDELEKQGITKIKVHYVDEKEYPHWNKNKLNETIWVSPYFAIYPNSPAKTVIESKEHKMLKDWLFNRLKKDDLKLVYATIKKPNKYKKFIKLSELNIDWNNYAIEVTTRGFKALRADVLLPFKEKHELFGNGIDFEIQLQNEKKISERSIRWALNVYSVVWLFEKDFDFNEDKTRIELKNKEPKIHSYMAGLYYGGKEFIGNLKNEVKNQSTLLNIKLNEIAEKVGKIIDKVQLKKENLCKEFEKRINGFLDKRIRELGNNFTEEIAKRIKTDFFTEKEEDLKNILKKTIKEVIDTKETTIIKELIEQKINEINIDGIITKIEKEVKDELRKNMGEFYYWKEMVQEEVECPHCRKSGGFPDYVNSPALKLVQTKKGRWKLVCETCKEWFNLPKEIENKLKGNKNG